MSNGAPIIIKKKKAHGHAHHGGSWKVAYADFVTAMMAFFLVMWIMGLSEQTRSIIAGYFNDPFGRIKSTPKANSAFSLPGSVNNSIVGDQRPMGAPRDAEAAHLEKIEGQVRSNIAHAASLQKIAKDIEVHMTPDGLRIELVEASDAAFFKTGSAVLNSEALAVIHKIAPVLIQSGDGIVVEGHTDARPYPSLTYTNWDLSSDRANSLRRALMSCGISGKQFRGVRAYADTKLEDKANPYDPRNRRVSILLPYTASTGDTAFKPKAELKALIQGVWEKHGGPPSASDVSQNSKSN